MSCRAAAMKSRSSDEAGRNPPAVARETYMSGSSSSSLTRMKRIAAPVVTTLDESLPGTR